MLLGMEPGPLQMLGKWPTTEPRPSICVVWTLCCSGGCRAAGHTLRTGPRWALNGSKESSVAFLSFVGFGDHIIAKRDSFVSLLCLLSRCGWRSQALCGSRHPFPGDISLVDFIYLVRKVLFYC
jgi:hypothetical protein